MIPRILAIAALLVLAGPAAAQGSPLPFTLKQIAPGVYAAIDGPEHKAGSILSELPPKIPGERFSKRLAKIWEALMRTAC